MVALVIHLHDVAGDEGIAVAWAVMWWSGQVKSRQVRSSVLNRSREWRGWTGGAEIPRVLVGGDVNVKVNRREVM